MHTRPGDFVNFETFTQYPLFLDKSQLISAIDRDRRRLSMIFRPSGFFKTFTLQMLKLFYSSPAHRDVFSQLAIGRDEKAMAQQGRHLVILLDFTDFQAKNFDQALIYFSKKMSEVYEEFSEILIRGGRRTTHFGPLDYGDYKNILKQAFWAADNSELLANSLANLISYFNNSIWANNNLVILIDGFDKPFEVSAKYGYSEKMQDFMWIFYSWVNNSTLNNRIRCAVAMGRHPIGHRLIPDGFCYLSDMSYFGRQNAPYQLGVTAEEIQRLVERNQLPANLMDEILNYHNNFQINSGASTPTTVIEPAFAMALLTQHLLKKSLPASPSTQGLFSVKPVEGEVGDEVLDECQRVALNK